MNYQQTLDFLFSTLPVFHRDGAIAYKPGLQNITRLCDSIGNPQRSFKCIHVAGTNGKGSTSSMLAAILQSSGYKTGLYTSPHIKNFTERIRIDGVEIAEDFVVDFVARNLRLIEDIRPSFFEITAALAFFYFAESKVDVAIIEVGVGGKFDSTNIISPILSIITNISYDHKDLLGDTLVEIAHQKAGIIKLNTPVVVSERQPEVELVFTETSLETGSVIYWASDNFQILSSILDQNMKYVEILDKIRNIKRKFSIDLVGNYQEKNVMGVLQAVSILPALGFHIPEESIIAGLSKIKSLTGLTGRWHKIQENPLVIADVGHNEGGLQQTLAQVKNGTFGHLHFILGFVKDKDVSSILRMFPPNASYYFCGFSNPRGLDPQNLKLIASGVGIHGQCYQDADSALAQCLGVASVEDFIYIGGSTFLLSDLSRF